MKSRYKMEATFILEIPLEYEWSETEQCELVRCINNSIYISSGRFNGIKGTNKENMYTFGYPKSVKVKLSKLP